MGAMFCGICHELDYVSLDRGFDGSAVQHCWPQRLGSVRVNLLWTDRMGPGCRDDYIDFMADVPLARSTQLPHRFLTDPPARGSEKGVAPNLQTHPHRPTDPRR